MMHGHDRNSTTVARASAGVWLLAGLCAMSACESTSVEQVETTAAVPVSVEAAALDTIRSVVIAGGTVVPAPGAELVVVAPAPARVEEITKAEGESIREGEVLVRFDIPNLASDVAARRASVAQATARLEAAKAAYARLSVLLSEGVAAPREVEEARRQQAEGEADLQQARSALEAAVVLSERAVVRARFDGVIAKRYHNPGDLVDASTSDPVLRVINPSQLQVLAAVTVADLQKVDIGRPAEIVVPGSEAPLSARVLTRASQVDPAGATADVRLVFLRPTRLAAGTVVRVAIVGDEHRDVLVIPAGAVVRDGDETFVMVAGDDNKAHKHAVEIGLAGRDRVEITTGLKAGDRVIIRGQGELPDGADVAIQ